LIQFLKKYKRQGKLVVKASEDCKTKSDMYSVYVHEFLQVTTEDNNRAKTSDLFIAFWHLWRCNKNTTRHKHSELMDYIARIS